MHELKYLGRLICWLASIALLTCCGLPSPQPATPSTDNDAGTAERPPLETDAATPVAPQMDAELARLVATLDDDAEPLHNDFTPAVHALIARDVEGALAVVDLLDAPNELTRLHAQRVVEGVAMRHCGWQAGHGFADGAIGEARMRTLLQRNGAYDWQAPSPARQRSMALWRAWLEANRFPANVTTTTGDLEGSFELERTHVVAGQPLWARFTIKNTSSTPLSFDWGGDYRGSFFPLRYHVVVTDESGQQLCESSKMMCMGGLGVTKSVEPGAEYSERLLLNPTCDAFLQPGRYRISLTRSLTQDSKLPSGCDALRVPDLTRADAPPAKMSNACFTALRTFPQVSSKLSLEVDSYDQSRLIATQKSEVQEIKRGVDPGYRTWYFQWVCRRLRCDCPQIEVDSSERTARWMSAVIKGMPRSLRPAGCP